LSKSSVRRNERRGGGGGREMRNEVEVERRDEK